MNRITRLLGRYHAAQLDVCRASGTVALHIQTTQGQLIITVDEYLFTTKCRGEADHIGNRFRTLAELRSPIAAALEGGTPLAPLTQMRRARAAGEFSRRCASAWEMLSRRPDIAAADVAANWGLAANSFSQWISYHHRGELRALRSAAGLPLKARRGAVIPRERNPVLKPGGKLL